jgi:hypothetical protein
VLTNVVGALSEAAKQQSNRELIRAEDGLAPLIKLIATNHPDLLKLILIHQESRCSEIVDIVPQHCSSKNESIQTIIFIQPGRVVIIHGYARTRKRGQVA